MGSSPISGKVSLRFSTIYISVRLLFRFNFSLARRTPICLLAGNHSSPRRVSQRAVGPSLSRGVFLPPLSFNASACAPRLCAPRFLLPASAGHPASAWNFPTTRPNPGDQGFCLRRHRARFYRARYRRRPFAVINLNSLNSTSSRCGMLLVATLCVVGSDVSLSRRDGIQPTPSFSLLSLISEIPVWSFDHFVRWLS